MFKNVFGKNILQPARQQSFMFENVFGKNLRQPNHQFNEPAPRLL